MHWFRAGCRAGAKPQAAARYICDMDERRGESNAATGDRLSGVWAAIIALLILYILPLLAVAIDELVLGTYWFAKMFPGDGMRDVFFTVYPFLRFLVE
jgi:hypothetical protein